MFVPWLQDKIWEWPWDEASHQLRSQHRPSHQEWRILCTKVGHNFGYHITPAKFYVSSDALVQLQMKASGQKR